MATIIQALNGGDPVLEPTVFKITKSDLYSDQSGRSAESGDMILYPIKEKVYSIAVEFVGSASEIKAIEALLKIGDFSVIFLDETNTESQSPYVTRMMYASDRSTEPLGVPSARKYRLSFNLIETGRSS